MSDLLNIGASALGSYRTALATVGDNVANAETPGYVRREVRLGSAGMVGSIGPLYTRGDGGPQGVRVAAVTRAADAFRDDDARLTQSDSARAEARSRWLTLAEKQLPDDDNGIGAKLTAVYTAADGLAANPEGAIPREQMTTAIASAAAGFRASGSGLAKLSAGIAAEAGQVAETLNHDLSELNTVNTVLRRLAPGTAGHSSALDQRDRLLGQISGAVGIDASFDERGVAKVTLAQSGGVVLLDRNGPAQIHIASATDGRVTLAVEHGGTTEAVGPVSGSLAGLVDSAASLAGRRRQLDALATDFASEINSWNTNGRTENGATGAALLDASGGAAAMTVLTDDPAALAAANASSSNGNALALTARRGTGGIEARAASLVTGLARSVAGAKAEAATASSTATAAALARDEVSGVDLDREAAELIRFQEAYNSAAKIVQVARETMQTILEII